jgi:hypothetical protein
MTDEQQIPTEQWEPSKLQLALLQAALSYVGKPTITNLCQAAGIDRSTFYDWLHDDPGFSKAWEGMWINSIDGSMPAIVEAQIEKATERQDTFAAQFLATLRGKFVNHVDLTSKGEKIGVEYISDWRGNAGTPEEKD